MPYDNGFVAADLRVGRLRLLNVRLIDDAMRDRLPAELRSRLDDIRQGLDD